MISLTSLSERAVARALSCVLVVLCQAGGTVVGNGAIEALEEPRIVLVIGNGAYADHPLSTASADAFAMARALKEYGFQVIQRIDADVVVGTSTPWMEAPAVIRTEMI